MNRLTLPLTTALALAWAVSSAGMLISLAAWTVGQWRRRRSGEQGACPRAQSHRAARDPLWLALAWLVVAAMPWNLPLWALVRRLRSAIEADCDARLAPAI